MNKEFQSHALNQAGITKSNAIAEAFDGLLEALVILCPPGRELALVRTKLEEASFFAKKAVASAPENHPTADNGCAPNVYAAGTTVHSTTTLGGA